LKPKQTFPQGKNETTIHALRAETSLEENDSNVYEGGASATYDGDDDELRFVTFEEVFMCVSDDKLHPEIRAKYVDLMIGQWYRMY